MVAIAMDTMDIAGRQTGSCSFKATSQDLNQHTTSTDTDLTCLPLRGKPSLRSWTSPET